MKQIKKNYTLFSCILDFGKGSKALELSKNFGCYEGTIFLGKGTVSTDWLNVLGALDIRKEIFITIIDEEKEDAFYEAITKQFNLDKPGHGIAFSMPLKYCIKLNNLKYESNKEMRGANKMNYECIFTIVDKGLSEDVLEAAESEGSTGGTVIHGRGTGTQEKAVLFNIKIEPEKDIVMILSKTEKTESIVDAIEKRLNISKPGCGIIFVMEVNKAIGLYKD
ncbi:MAG: P-II family nitrogen regulator [Firmicutes bacterium]|nr:P-II family nitrogen regulator [Bacillota bacterium]